LVVYTGNETKVGKNKNKPPVKWTKAGSLFMMSFVCCFEFVCFFILFFLFFFFKKLSIDRFINRTTMFIFCLQLSLVVVFGIVGDVYQSEALSLVRKQK
jgi:hypothetical protein